MFGFYSNLALSPTFEDQGGLNAVISIHLKNLKQALVHNLQIFSISVKKNPKKLSNVENIWLTRHLILSAKCQKKGTGTLSSY